MSVPAQPTAGECVDQQRQVAPLLRGVTDELGVVR